MDDKLANQLIHDLEIAGGGLKFPDEGAWIKSLLKALPKIGWKISKEEFKDYPSSITEIKSNKSGLGSDWLPRDALISLLRRIDSGEIKPESMVILYHQKLGSGAIDFRYTASSPDFTITLGVIEGCKLKIWEDSSVR